jgi:hypothetical protein
MADPAKDDMENGSRDSKNLKIILTLQIPPEIQTNVKISLTLKNVL